MELKALVRDKVANTLNLLYREHPIEVLEKILLDLKTNGATHFDLYVNKDWDGCVEDIEFEGYKISYETPEQAQERVEREQKAAEKKNLEIAKQVKQLELETLAKLKAKYEGTNTTSSTIS